MKIFKQLFAVMFKYILKIEVLWKDQLECGLLHRWVGVQGHQYLLHARCKEILWLQYLLHARCKDILWFQYLLHARCIDISWLQYLLHARCKDILWLQYLLHARCKDILWLQYLHHARCKDILWLCGLLYRWVCVQSVPTPCRLGRLLWLWLWFCCSDGCVYKKWRTVCTHPMQAGKITVTSTVVLLCRWLCVQSVPSPCKLGRLPWLWPWFLLFRCLCIKVQSVPTPCKLGRLLWLWLWFCCSGGCVYKNSLYPLGAKWEDGCDFDCQCIDGTTGLYQCTAKWVSVDTVFLYSVFISLLLCLSLSASVFFCLCLYFSVCLCFFVFSLWLRMILFQNPPDCYCLYLSTCCWFVPMCCLSVTVCMHDSISFFAPPLPPTVSFGCVQFVISLCVCLSFSEYFS